MVASANWMKLLAAGCVVSLLSSVAVQAEAEAEAPGAAVDEVDGDVGDEEMPADGDGYGEYDGDDGDEYGGEDGDEYGGEDGDEYGGEDGDDAGDEEAPADDGDDGEEAEPPAEGPAEEPAEEPAEDAFESPAEASVEDAPAEPQVEEMPEEMGDEDAAAPDSEMMDDGETTPDADPAALEGLGYTATQGLDYIPGAGKADMGADISSSVVGSAEECAEVCTAEANCNMATYFTAEFPNGMNCWLKSLSPGCTVPADTDPAENAWLLVSAEKCEVEVVAMAPMADAAAPAAAAVAAGSGDYTRYEGSDYIPSSVTGFAPNQVTIADIGTGENSGLLVESVEECEAACDLEPTCNTASFYVTLIADTGKNCYLKVLGESCELPADAIMDDNAILSLKCTDASAPVGVDTVAAAPPASVVPPAAPGFATPPASEDAAPTETTRGTDLTGAPTDDAAVEEGTPSSAGAVCTSVAAVAMAGVVALL